MQTFYWILRGKTRSCGCDSNSFGSSASESSSSALGVAQSWKFLQSWVEDSFANQLGDTVALSDSKLDIRVVEQNDANVAAVIFVNDSSSDIDEVLSCQSRTRSDAAIATFGKLNLDVRFDNELSTGRNHAVISAS